MTPEAFKRTLEDPSPPPASAAIRALWYDATGDWDAAHDAIQDDESRDAAWVHAYLHRKEGDNGNARYWYARAGRPYTDQPLSSEWEDVLAALLNR